MYSRVFRNLLIVSRKYSASKINQVKVKNPLGGRNAIRTCYSSAAASENDENSKHLKRGDLDSELIHEEGESWFTKHKEEKGKDRLEKMLQDPKTARYYKIIELEIEVMRQSGDNVPEQLRDREWVELLMMDSRSKRRRFLEFLFGLEKKEEHKRQRRQARAEEVERLREAGLLKPSDSDIPLWLQYTLGGNSMFLRIRDSTINKICNWRLHRAAMWAPKIVIDCGFENKMTRFETRNCAKQLQFGFAINREHSNPLDLHFCNFNKKGYLFEEFYSFIPTLLEPEFPINLHEKSYLDLFPKDKLVYLTPDCHQMMESYDADAIYIIGALVDKIAGNPTTLAKAKREGLRMAKLPIDKYLSFGSGSNKSLTINQMIAILGDFYHSGDWHLALQHVPRRKLLESRQSYMRKRLSYYLQNPTNKNRNQQQYDSKNSSEARDFSIESRNKFRSK